ncbi:hypothetical protein [Rhodococcus pyridinivorans]|uniref:hypothetical protein n=1 Tax=Rhodococcus pyridinivorans TaxID=103816 RepID=UPI00110DF2C0|nr:hypothetical protein [Rhodococcus pyridinivorans]
MNTIPTPRFAATTYHTIAVTALPEPWIVLLNVDGDTEQFAAPALLLQRSEATGETRIVFGVLNPERGELEPVDADIEDSGGLGEFMSAYPRSERF